MIKVLSFILFTFFLCMSKFFYTVYFVLSQSQEDRAKRRRLNEEARLEAQVQGQLQGQEEANDQTQEEANDQAQEEAEMEADFMAQLVEDQPQFEVQDISSTAPQPTQVLRRSNRLASLLFG